ncbi:hypothetical protein AB1N83_003395 [Pleurotus pulmonarius]
MALSDYGGYCENCAVRKSFLLRLYDGVTFIMICEMCYHAQGHVIKAGNGHEHRLVYHMRAANPQHIYRCRYANLGCPEGNSHAGWEVYEHSRICKWASTLTCTTCWQSIPLADYAAHKDGSQRDLGI